MCVCTSIISYFFRAIRSQFTSYFNFVISFLLLLLLRCVVLVHSFARHRVHEKQHSHTIIPIKNYCHIRQQDYTIQCTILFTAVRAHCSHIQCEVITLDPDHCAMCTQKWHLFSGSIFILFAFKFDDFGLSLYSIHTNGGMRYMASHLFCFEFN